MAVAKNYDGIQWTSSVYYPEPAYIRYHEWIKREKDKVSYSSWDEKYYNIDLFPGPGGNVAGRGYWCEVEDYPLVQYAGLNDGVNNVGRETYKYKDSNDKTQYTYKAAAAEITSPNDGAKFTTNDRILVIGEAAGLDYVEKYNWYLDGKLVKTAGGNYLGSYIVESYSFEGLSAGKHTIGFEAENPDGFKMRYTIDVIVKPAGGPGPQNQAPTADAGADQTVMVDTSVNFDGSVSTDSDGTIVSYDWDFNDGSAHGTGATPTHTYTTAGTYAVTLTVTDNDGATDTDTMTVTVNTPAQNQDPVANAGSNQAVQLGTAVSFDGSASTDSDGTITSYAWTFGDGNSGTGATPTHTYSAVGTYTVTLTVTDNDGATDTDTMTVTVTSASGNIAPVANAGNDVSETVNTSIQFSGATSYDSDGSIVSYYWNFGDGNTGTGATPTHTYTSIGTYTVTLTVTDNDGATAVDSLVATISTTGQQSTPTAYAGMDKTVPVGTDVSFHGYGQDVDGTIDEYLWNFGDGSTTYGQTVIHAYSTVDTYTVTLTVTDNDGLTDTDTLTVTVTEQEVLINEINITADPVKGGDEVFIRIVGNNDTGVTGINVTINGTDYELDEVEDDVFEGNITAPADEGVYEVTITARKGEYTETATVNLTVDNTVPQILSVEPATDTEVETEYVTLRITTDEVAVCRYSTTTDSFDQMTEFANTNDTLHTTSVKAEPGENRYYVLCQDVVGNTPDTYQEITFIGPLPEGEWTGVTGLAGLNLMDPFVAGGIVLVALITGSFVCFVKRREIFTRFLE
jgi:PKD repeat protein